MGKFHYIPRGTKVHPIGGGYRDGTIEEVVWNPIEGANEYWVAITPYYSVLFSEDELEVLE